MQTFTPWESWVESSHSWDSRVTVVRLYELSPGPAAATARKPAAKTRPDIMSLQSDGSPFGYKDLTADKWVSQLLTVAPPTRKDKHVYTYIIGHGYIMASSDTALQTGPYIKFLLSFSHPLKWHLLPSARLQPVKRRVTPSQLPINTHISRATALGHLQFTRRQPFSEVVIWWLGLITLPSTHTFFFCLYLQRVSTILNQLKDFFF